MNMSNNSHIHRRRCIRSNRYRSPSFTAPLCFYRIYHLLGYTNFTAMMMAGGKHKAPDGTTTQEIKEKQHQLTKQQESLDTCAHILSIFIARPDIYQTASAKKIREQIQFIQANPTKFPPYLEIIFRMTLNPLLWEITHHPGLQFLSPHLH